MSQPAVSVQRLGKDFRLYRERNQNIKSLVLRGRRAVYEDFQALDDVSIDVPWGTTFALMGDNGSGKSTLLKCIARILNPTRGNVEVHGKLAALLELGSGFHPELSGRDNIYLNGAILGLSRRELDARLEQIIDFSGVEQFIDQPIKTYSSGMYVRLGFSVAINVEPEILLVDEVLAVGDAAFQDKCLEKFGAFRDAGRTVILVTHSMGAVRQLCDHGVWLDHGRVMAHGTATSVVTEYLQAVYAHEAHADECGLRIDDVKVLQGGRAARLEPMTPFSIHVDLERLATGPDAELSVAIMTVPGVVVTDLATPLSASPVLNGSTMLRATLDLPGLALAPGRYEVRASVAPAGRPVRADHRDVLAEFEVGSSGSGGASILAPGASWNVSGRA